MPLLLIHVSHTTLLFNQDSAVNWKGYQYKKTVRNHNVVQQPIAQHNTKQRMFCAFLPIHNPNVRRCSHQEMPI